MCTVVVRVPEPGSTDPVRLLAVRDEDPARPWRSLGEWWTPGVVGVLDELAGGAWLASDGRRLAVLLNREGMPDVPLPTTRGALVLDAVAGRGLPDPLTTQGFNLVEATARTVRVTSWTGRGAPVVTELSPGTHMVAHDDVDDPGTPRIAAWRDRFASAPTDGAEGRDWWEPWVRVLGETAEEVAAEDDRAIIRDNRPHGFPTLSLMVAVASLGEESSELAAATLAEPGRWDEPVLERA